MRPQLHVKTLLLTVVGTCLALTLLHTTEPKNVFPVGKYVLMDENGNSITSIFKGLPHLPADAIALKSTPKCDSDSAKESLLTRVKNIFTLESVHAQSCQTGGCYGHYFLTDYLDCPPACEGPLYPNAYSDGTGHYSTGYHQDGLTGCPLSACAFCRTVTCSNP